MAKTGTRTLVLQNHVQEHLLITLISFAATVSLTRLFLELTGYPQIGSGELHIAHVLWGGLILFIGSLTAILFSNRSALATSALLSGVGIGLFIDEVGKFITQSNDYFYPSAAPIIYSFFLLTVLIFIEIRKPREKNGRAYLYNAFQDMEEVLDNDLSIKEQRQLIIKLDNAIKFSEEPQLKDLAVTLKDYLLERESYLVPHQPTFLEKWKFRYLSSESKFFKRRRFRFILAMSLIVWGIYSIFEPIIILRAFNDAAFIEKLISDLINQRLVRNASGLNWFEAQVIMEGLIGITSIFSGILILIKRELIGLRIGSILLLLTLTAGNILMFYFDQFSTIANATVQFIIFLMILRYRKRFLSSQ
jgi:hypothetical protein